MFGIFKSKKTRKERTEDFLKQYNIKLNPHLPHIESEEEITLRTSYEIAARATILALTNVVAFDGMTTDQAIECLKENKLWHEVTLEEKDFLAHPTQEKKNKESWKCECIWVLLWALQVINDLEFPDHLCDLNVIADSNYPIHDYENLQDYIKRPWKIRSKKEILDAADMYYRMNWACVDARINGRTIETLNCGVVYERQYALNWLINYMNQDWDNITCDT